MKLEDSYGFRSAEAAYENATPLDDDCTCLDDLLFICPECGYCDADREMACPHPLCEGRVQEVSESERRENYPAVGCPQHDANHYTDEDAADDAREHDYESRMGN